MTYGSWLERSQQEKGNDVAIRPWRSLLWDEEGLETVEYAIIAGMLIVGALAVIAAIGAWVLNVLQTALTDLEG